MLSGTVDYMVVPADVDHTKFFTDEELDKHINDPDVNVHVDTITGDEDVVAVV